MRVPSLVLLLTVAVSGITAMAGAQAWVPYDGAMPANAVMPTRDNPHAGAICRMTGPSDLAQKHLLGSVQERDGELVCRGVTYSAGKYGEESARIIADLQFEVLVIEDVPRAETASSGAVMAHAESDCPWETHYDGHLFCEGSVNWENLKPKVGVEEIWQGLLCVRALEDCGERGGNGSVVCRRWDAK